MTAVTPDIAGQAALPPSVSRPVAVNDLPWRATPFAGVEQKVLLRDEDRGLITALIRMAPGARLPLHEHVDIEQTYVLDGSLADDEGNEITAGDFIWRPAGHRHVAWSPNGALMIGIFLQPNRFLEPAE
ncbi:MAG: cupin domain-containing protein [Alphaproteobacteria bacterium]|nr:cupin domain-containing protein [Alphaproteobacteria bacterium]